MAGEESAGYESLSGACPKGNLTDSSQADSKEVRILRKMIVTSALVLMRPVGYPSEKPFDAQGRLVLAGVE